MTAHRRHWLYESAQIRFELERPEDWTVDALCAQVDPDAWFPEKGGTTVPAKLICAHCPVLVECLAYALRHHERDGVWGGTSPRERRAMLKAPVLDVAS
jgi:WhiB family transcriptional regulator, redox-sensing transcriptional regulator